MGVCAGDGFGWCAGGPPGLPGFGAGFDGFAICSRSFRVEGAASPSFMRTFRVEGAGSPTSYSKQVQKSAGGRHGNRGVTDCGGSGRRNADEALALALACGQRLREAVITAGIAERTATQVWPRRWVHRIRCARQTQRKSGQHWPEASQRRDECRRLTKARTASRKRGSCCRIEK